ncbi:aldehyde dehydrogenase (NADP(+)) [Pedobacter changchengzhani]|uniref:Aldehyde dehydrogenase (NADP(+)) n=1 Tax=Pedobacter changchengzhani TaxID=2529274 RepID=A0A4R5MMQ0_9SPHI|nr:aldehyde dehydrogenase (NADP(+)) [Pedobacter changchengzhani]TDG37030.1 aldehyde dehydrogenase (NADP(+)) [Pedobacter changchengzhani]
MYKNHTTAELDEVIAQSVQAFHQYKKFSLKQRADFMRAIAVEIEALGDVLLTTAAEETNLPLARLTGERGRTMFQLNAYADATEGGDWLGASIDTANAERVPPKPDTRKMLVPLGPVVVFGASNFPFAYSTAGGDTATAFAAGCSVIVKAHPAHSKTSTLVASAIEKAAEKTNMPKGIFAHVYGSGFETGEHLTKHEAIKAVAFTGSFSGGKALFDWANQRENPIPVFAEMGSVNPVFLLPEKLAEETASLAKQMAGSVTLGVGQFCTNPGLMVAIDGAPLEQFLVDLKNEIEQIAPSAMLHAGISANYSEKLTAALAQKGVEVVGETSSQTTDIQGKVTVATVSADVFLANPVLHQEVFGPYSLIIKCKDKDQLLAVTKAMEGQLTCTLMATKNDINAFQDLLSEVREICGRLIFNNVPTGVEVALSMQHGGPYPASTDSRFTSVGADGIKRFARPLCYQNMDDEFLPTELQNANPLNINRTINNVLSKDKI